MSGPSRSAPPSSGSGSVRTSLLGTPEQRRRALLDPWPNGTVTLSMGAAGVTPIAGGTNRHINTLVPANGIGSSALAEVRGGEIGICPQATFYWSSLYADAGNLGDGACPWSLRLITDATELAVNMQGNQGRIRVRMDGRICVDGSGVSVFVAGTGAGSDYWLDIVNPDTKLHEWTFEFASARVGYLRFPTSTTRIAAPGREPGPRVVGIGDSILQATAGGPFAHDNFLNLACRRLGIFDVWPSAVGGTGALNPGPGGNATKTYPNRLATDLYPYAPDISVIGPFTNDNNQAFYPTATLQSTIAAMITDIKTNLPNTRIVFLSSYWPRSSDMVSGGAIEQSGAVKAAIDAAGGANAGIHYIDLVTSPIFTGSGRVGATTGLGNCDYNVSSDNVHPTDNGQQTFADRIARRFEQILQGAA